MFRKHRERKFLESTSEIVLSFLMLQTRLSESKKDSATGLLDLWARGYVFGALDAVLQHSLIRHESEQGLSIINPTIAAIHTTTEEQAKELFIESLGLQDEPEFEAGVMCGGTEMQRFLDKNTTGIMGLGEV